MGNGSYLCHGSFVFTVQLRLASPGLLFVKKREEWAMRNNLHEEIALKSSNFLTQREKMKHNEGLEKSKMAPQTLVDHPPKAKRAAESHRMTSPLPRIEVWTSSEPRITSVDFTGVWNNIITGGPI
jgi:hypothetical protein